MPYKDREARNAYARRWYAGHKEAHIQRVRIVDERRRIAASALLEEIKSHPCADCHVQYEPQAMDFDHVRGTKDFSLGEAAWRGYSLERIKAEVAKCDLVCANCHRVRTRRRREEK